MAKKKESKTAPQVFMKTCPTCQRVSGLQWGSMPKWHNPCEHSSIPDLVSRARAVELPDFVIAKHSNIVNNEYEIKSYAVLKNKPLLVIAEYDDVRESARNIEISFVEKSDLAITVTPYEVADGFFVVRGTGWKTLKDRPSIISAVKKAYAGAS